MYTYHSLALDLCVGLDILALRPLARKRLNDPWLDDHWANDSGEVQELSAGKRSRFCPRVWEFGTAEPSLSQIPDLPKYSTDVSKALGGRMTHTSIKMYILSFFGSFIF